MTGVSNQALVSLRSLMGVDNASPLFDARQRFTDQGQLIGIAMREIENLDLTRGDKPRLRPGQARVVEGASHSLWAPPGHPWGLVVHDGNLCSWAPGAAPAPITAAHPFARTHYARLPYGLAWSNGVDIGLVRDDRVNYAVAPSNPPGQPQAAPAANGSMHAGRYQVAITWVDAHGRESGTGLAREVTISEGQGIALTSFPTPPADIDFVRVYCTGPNDSLLSLRIELVTPVSAWTLLSLAEGPLLQTQFLEPIPPGTYLNAHAGRLLLARERTLIWSGAMRYGQYRRSSQWIRFPSGITMIQGIADGETGSGIYVGTAHGLFWLSGSDPAEWNLERAWGYGVQSGAYLKVPGSAINSERAGDVVVFITSQGVLSAGLPGGQVNPLSQDKFYTDVGQQVAMHLRESAGERHLIATMQGGIPSTASVGDKLTVQVFNAEGSPIL